MNKTPTANYSNFQLKLNTAHIRYAEIKMWRRERR